MQQRTAEAVILGGAGAVTITFFGIPISDWTQLAVLVSVIIATGFRIHQWLKDNRHGK